MRLPSLARLPLTQEGRAKAEQGFDVTHFTIDWQQQQVMCPTGQNSRLWINTPDRHGKDVIQIKFNPAACQECPCRILCTKARIGSTHADLTPSASALSGVARSARERQTTTTFKEEYARRAGIEGTIAQGVHAFDLRRSRYIGLAKTRLQHLMIASSLNLVRMGAWLMEKPRAHTRVSRFGRLAPLQQEAA
jgi:transposase